MPSQIFTAKARPEFDQYKGKTGQINIDGLLVNVVIKDARLRFGHRDFLVTPVVGSGEQWFESHRVEIYDKEVEKRHKPMLIEDAFGDISLDSEPF